MSVRTPSRLQQSIDYLKGALWNTISFPTLPADSDLDRHVDDLRDRYAKLRGAVDSEPEVSVVIPVHVIEPKDTLLTAMTSLLFAEDAPATEVVVVVNGKVPTSALLESDLHRLCERIGFRTFTLSYLEDERYQDIKRPQNIFVPKGRGFEEARGRIVIFTDIDCVYSRRWIRAYVDAFDADPDLLAAYGPPQNYGATGPVGRLMIATSTIVKALKILVDFAPFAGHNHAMRKELCGQLPKLFEQIEGNNNDLPGIIARELSIPRDITSFTRCVAEAKISTYFPKQTESPAQAIRWFFSATRRNLRNFARLLRNKKASASTNANE